MDNLKSVSIQAEIPENTVTIFGYTSPSSRVELGSAKAFAVTYSQSDGYFIFDHIILPKHPQDYCLTSTDESFRQNQATCLPEPPLTNSYTEIGPVLLPPTISLDLSQNFSSGQSIPNTTIKVYLYQQSSNFKLIKNANAFSIPIIETKTDSQGNYSLSIPDTSPTNYRLFSVVNYLESDSPKSNTLLYHPPSSNFFLYIIFIFLALFLFYFIFKKSRRRFLPALYYNKTIAVFKK